MPKPPRKSKPPAKAAAEPPRGAAEAEREACDDRDEGGDTGARNALKGVEATEARGPDDETPDVETEKKFVESLVATGQAAPVDEEGKLPPGATHELVETEEGKLKAVRRRYSIV